MGNSLTIGKIRGIAIGINYTWLIALGLITWSLAVGFFPAQFRGWSPATYWSVAFFASLLLFGSVLAHELTHSFVAQHLGMRVQSISLFVFGGVSNIVGEAKSARDEFYIAAVGPLSSFILAVAFGLVFFATRHVNGPVAALLFYLASVNLLLAVFNLIPGFPLDGGRVFRAIVWGITHNFRRATDVATMVGKGVAYLFMLGGLFIIFRGDFLSGIWLAFIGWFLSEAATSSYRQMTMQESLRGVHVADIMNQQPVTADKDLTLAEVVEQYILKQNLRALLVTDDGALVGLVTLGEIRAIPGDRWPTTSVADVMTPLDRLYTVSPQDDLSQAMRSLSEEDVNQLPVVDHGRLVGVLSRGNLIRFLQVRQELGHQSRA